jgi:hypothetical protein
MGSEAVPEADTRNTAVSGLSGVPGPEASIGQTFSGPAPAGQGAPPGRRVNALGLDRTAAPERARDAGRASRESRSADLDSRSGDAREYNTKTDRPQQARTRLGIEIKSHLFCAKPIGLVKDNTRYGIPIRPRSRAERPGTWWSQSRWPGVEPSEAGS